MNVVKDKIFTGRILDMVESALSFIRDQIKDHTYLGKDGRFVTTPEYPEFVWKEVIVNAATHRDYSIKGTDIQIKMFDNRMEVESPGNLPGIVRLSNMRRVHFSRNPKIAAFLHEYDYVQEFGEGVDRMYREMEQAGLPAPEYQDNAFMLNATIRNGAESASNDDSNVHNGPNDVPNDVPNPGDLLSETEARVLQAIIQDPSLSAQKIADRCDISKKTVTRACKFLKEKGLIIREGGTRGKWIILK